MIIAAPGSRSEGLSIRVFPVAIAIGIVHNGIILSLESGRAQEQRKLHTLES